MDRLVVELKVADCSHLRELSSFLGLDKSPKVYKNCARLEKSDTELCDLLQSYGIVPRKSQTATADKRLVGSRDFWRGVVDGDGCVGKYGRYSYPRLSVVGSTTLMAQFVEFSRLQGIGFRSKVQKHGKYSSVACAAGTAYALGKILYKENDVSLVRKQREVLSW